MKRFLKIVLRWSLYACLFFFGSSLMAVLFYALVPPPVTPLMVIRSAGQVFSGKKIVLEKEWKSLDHISENLQLAVIASEDNRFLEHHGFDLEAIKKAQEYNERKNGKRVRGASTISQQTAKNVFLWPARSWVRKGFEVYFTALIELIWSKKRIMEVYLNVIEMGDGIYGAEAAAEHYFGKPAAQLTRGEGALIAAALPNPRKFNPGRPSGYLQGRQQWILWNMGNFGKIKY